MVMKKSLKIILSLLALIIVGILFQSINSYKNIDSLFIYEQVLNKNPYIKEMIKDYAVIECNSNLFNREYAFVSNKYYSPPELNYYWDLYRVIFYEPRGYNTLTGKWEIVHTGGADVKQVDFSKLIEMVKGNCFQFKTDMGHYDDKTINWVYSDYIYEFPESELAENVLARRKLLEEDTYPDPQYNTNSNKIDIIKFIYEYHPFLAGKQLLEEYGDVDFLPDDTIVSIYDEMISSDTGRNFINYIYKEMYEVRVALKSGEIAEETDEEFSR